MVKTIYFLRHGTVGMDGRFIGSSNLPLTEQGIKQVKQARLVLSTTPFSRVYVSPLLRCTQSLKEVDIAAESEILNELSEINFGDWEGQDYNALLNNFPNQLESWQQQPDTFCFPGGDSIADFHHRMARLADALNSEDFENMLIITHGGVIRHLICRFLKLPFTSYLLFDVKPGSIAKVKLFSQGGILCGLNMGKCDHG